MSWKVSDVMSQRKDFVVLASVDGANVLSCVSDLGLLARLATSGSTDTANREWRGLAIGQERLAHFGRRRTMMLKVLFWRFVISTPLGEVERFARECNISDLSMFLRQAR